MAKTTCFCVSAALALGQLQVVGLTRWSSTGLSLVGSSGPAIVCRSGPAASHPALEVQQQQQELTQRKRQHREGFLLDPLCVCFGRAKLGLRERPGEGRGEPQVARPSVSVLIFLETFTRA